MRNFEERMQEIQKRSNARITRRRKQLTAFCLPLVAALCVGGVLLIPQPTTYHSEDTVPTVTPAALHSASVTVMHGSESVTYSSPGTVDAVQQLLKRLLPVEDTTVNAVQEYNHEFTTQKTALTTNYTIILETEEAAVRYKLLGKLLSNLDTGEQFVLSDLQCAALSELLGLD